MPWTANAYMAQSDSAEEGAAEMKAAPSCHTPALGGCHEGCQMSGRTHYPEAFHCCDEQLKQQVVQSWRYAMSRSTSCDVRCTQARRTNYGTC